MNSLENVNVDKIIKKILMDIARNVINLKTIAYLNALKELYQMIYLCNVIKEVF